MTHGTPVSSHVIRMIDMIERLEKYGIHLHSWIQQDLILQSLPDTFSQFIVNYHMNGLDATPPQLLNMLKTAESNFPKKGQVLLTAASSSKKKKKTSFIKKKKSTGPKGGVALILTDILIRTGMMRLIGQVCCISTMLVLQEVRRT